jgi:hypothetical protein
VLLQLGFPWRLPDFDALEPAEGYSIKEAIDKGATLAQTGLKPGRKSIKPVMSAMILTGRAT